MQRNMWHVATASYSPTPLPILQQQSMNHLLRLTIIDKVIYRWTLFLSSRNVDRSYTYCVHIIDVDKELIFSRALPPFILHREVRGQAEIQKVSILLR